MDLVVCGDVESNPGPTHVIEVTENVRMVTFANVGKNRVNDDTRVCTVACVCGFKLCVYV